ncbi:MAG: N-acetyl-gamma-glutamyl-phosphate reductase, partial [Proteobacteria bacterium]|nr:N-acetyl-gamma-glutamyl-phosphate reductase [Pseudomonadota bacterium]
QQYIGKRFSDVFPAFKNVCDVELKGLNIIDIDADVVFTALPHHESYQVVKPLLEKGLKVIDLSADFRFKNHERYKNWYGEHPFFELSKSAVYGLPEIYREEIKKARLIGNPGCYPTSAIIPLYPLLKEGIIDGNGIIVDSKSGVSGAGRGLSLKTHFCEVYGGFKAYNVTQHRHQPEIEEQLESAGEKVSVLFTPHLLPIKRGILTTTYSRIVKDVSENDLYEIYEKYYSMEPFVRIFKDELPSVEAVVGSNFVDMAVKIDKNTKTVITISALDNLTKGASGQAVQNMNLMLGIDEKEGLEIIPLYP